MVFLRLEEPNNAIKPTPTLFFFLSERTNSTSAGFEPSANDTAGEFINSSDVIPWSDFSMLAAFSDRVGFSEAGGNDFLGIMGGFVDLTGGLLPRLERTVGGLGSEFLITL